MQHKRLVNALKKVGATITTLRADDGDGRGHYEATGPTGEKIDWHTEPGWVHQSRSFDPKKPSVDFTVYRHPDHDVMTDLFMNSYYHTIKESVRAIT